MVKKQDKKMRFSLFNLINHIEYLFIDQWGERIKLDQSVIDKYNKLENMNLTKEKQDYIFDVANLEGVSMSSVLLSTGLKHWGIVRFKSIDCRAEKEFKGESFIDISNQINTYLNSL